MTEFDETFGQDVQQHSPDELDAGEGHQLVLRAVGVGLVVEGHRVGRRVEGPDPTIGNPHPMGVTREIGQHGLGPGKRALGINHKVFLGGVLEQLGKSGRGSVGCLLAVELQFSLLLKLLESGAELASEHGRECEHRKKPMRRRAGPGAVIAQSATGDDGMAMVVLT